MEGTGTRVMLAVMGRLSNEDAQWLRGRLQTVPEPIFLRMGDTYAAGDFKSILRPLRTRQGDVLASAWAAVANPRQRVPVGHLYGGADRRDRRIRRRFDRLIAVIRKTAPRLAGYLDDGLRVQNEHLCYCGLPIVAEGGRKVGA